jgi:hypothetical protein
LTKPETLYSNFGHLFFLRWSRANLFPYIQIDGSFYGSVITTDLMSNEMKSRCKHFYAKNNRRTVQRSAPFTLQWSRLGRHRMGRFHKSFLPNLQGKYTSGVDVMITIFWDFWQFSAKKLAFFSKNNVMIKFLRNLALFWVKNANFLLNFSAKIFRKS